MNERDELMRRKEKWEARLDKLDPGSKEYNAVAEQVIAVTNQIIDLDKFDSEQDVKVQIANAENEQRQKELENERKSRWIGYGVQLAVVLIPMTVGTIKEVWGTKFTVNFEEHGTTTTTAGRNHFNNLFRRK